MKTRHAVLSLAVLAFLPAVSALATDSFRCGTHVISQGLPKRELVQYCGEPEEKHDDIWIYDWGPERQRMVVHLDRDGKIDRISSE
jgi:hypothetical protein